MNRGDVYWVDLNPTKGSEINKVRPCVVVSASPINKVRRTVVVVPLSTSTTERPPISVAVSCLNKSVIAICDQIRTVDKSRLSKPADTLSSQDLNILDQSLRQVLSL